MRVTALTACAIAALIAGSDDAPPPPPPAAAKPAAARPAAPPPVAAVAAPADGGVVDAAPFVYAYNPVGKRDPFRTYQVDPNRVTPDVPGVPREATNKCDEPLCKFDLEQLSLVAVVSGDANPLAMVEDPDRVGHMVHRNTRMGKGGGKVTSILRDCVVVTQYFQGPDGKSNADKVNLCVKKETAASNVVDLLTNKAVE